MNRSSFAALTVLLPFSLLACDGDGSAPPAPPTSRNNAILASSGTPSAVTATSSVAAAPQKPPRDPCKGQTPRSGPKGTLKTKAAEGATAPPNPIAFGAGKWVWLNFWAAWCGPCKEEMPRLLAWQNKLQKAGVLIDFAFVSLDDDERQLERFLADQPKAGVRASYWAEEGSARTKLLDSLNFKDSVQLPIQALISPDGQLACTIEGAIEDRDYDAIAAFVGAKK